MAFVRVQIETAVTLELFDTAVLGSAAIARQRDAHHDVQNQVYERGAEQNRKRPKHAVIGPGNAAGNKAEDDQGNAEPLRKILAGVQLAAWAHEAAIDLPPGNRIVRNRDLLPTMRTIERRRFRGNGLADRPAATGAVVCNIHRHNWREESR